MATKRSKKPSNAVKQTATVGSSLVGLGAIALGWASVKYQLDGQTVAAIGAAMTQFIALGVAWKSKGGRQGESE